MRWFRTENGLVARQLGREDVQVAATESGVYTPEHSQLSNYSDTTTFEVFWFRIDNVVTINGLFNADPTGTNIQCAFNMSYPPGFQDANLVSISAAGQVVASGGAGNFEQAGFMAQAGDGINASVQMQYQHTAVNMTHYFHYAFRLK